MVMWRWVLLKHFPFGTPTHTHWPIFHTCVCTCGTAVVRVFETTVGRIAENHYSRTTIEILSA